MLPDRCTLPPPLGNRCSRSRLFAFYIWRPPFENSAFWHGTTGARGACIKGPWQWEVPTHARSVNWLRCFSVAPFGCQAPENLGSGKNFRSSNASPKVIGVIVEKLKKKKKLHPKGQTASIAQTGLISGERGRWLKKNQLLLGACEVGTLCLFLITIKAPQSLLTPKVLNHTRKTRRHLSQGAAWVSGLGRWCHKEKNITGQGWKGRVGRGRAG